MATYSVTLYHNTGFDAINIPDNPSTLRAAASSVTTVDDVVILQDFNLDHIDVRATWDEVNDVDYVKVGSYYYSVKPYGITMLSASVARIGLVGDMMLSVGGVTYSNGAVSSQFTIMGGITDRCTTDSDNWGEYTSEDPLTAPQMPLQLKTEWLQPSGGNTPDTIDGDPILVETTVDLPGQYALRDGRTYTDEDTGETVTIPSVRQIHFNDADNGDTSTVPPDVWDQRTRFIVDGNTTSNGDAVFVKNDTNTSNITVGDAEAGTVESGTAGEIVEKGLQEVRALGIESGTVLNQYKLPKEFCGGMSIRYGYTYIGTGIDKKCISQDVYSIKGTSGTLSGTIAPNYATVKNKRVLYGKVNSYGLATCAGNSCTFKPEEITTQSSAPDISYKSDPRPKGKPYYRFTNINGNSEFWRNALSGSEWENVPLIYQGASGSALTRLNFENETRIDLTRRTNNEDTALFSTIGNVAKIATGIGEIGAGAIATAASGGAAAGLNAWTVPMGATSIASGVAGLSGTLVGQETYNKEFQAQRASELSQFYQATEVYAPTVTFPYNADILRDVKNNGVLLYKYEMTEEDVARVDKLLTMYGYKTSEPLTILHFFHRQHFDYIACSSVSIGGLPKWQADEIATQLKSGVRIWHEKPDSSIYDSGNNIRS